MYLDANRGNLNTFFDQIDNICWNILKRIDIFILWCFLSFCINFVHPVIHRLIQAKTSSVDTDANRGNLNTFFDQIDNICLLYIV
jgi:hypothetical protein